MCLTGSCKYCMKWGQSVWRPSSDSQLTARSSCFPHTPTLIPICLLPASGCEAVAANRVWAKEIRQYGHSGHLSQVTAAIQAERPSYWGANITEVGHQDRRNNWFLSVSAVITTSWTIPSLHLDLHKVKVIHTGPDTLKYVCGESEKHPLCEIIEPSGTFQTSTMSLSAII